MADPKNIANELQGIKDKISATQKLVEQEKLLNEQMLRSTGVRKKYTDALTAVAEIQKDILDEEREYARELKDQKKNLDEAIAKHAELETEMDNLTKRQQELTKNNKQSSDEFRKNADKIKLLNTRFTEGEKAVGRYKTSIKDTIDKVNTLKGSAGKMNQTFKDLKDLGKMDIKGFEGDEGLIKNAEKRRKITLEQLGLLVRQGKLSAKEARSLRDQLQSSEGIAESEGDALKAKTSTRAHGMIDEMVKMSPVAGGMKGAQGRVAMDLSGQKMGGIKALLSSKSGIGDRIKAADSLKNLKGDFNKLGEVMKATGGKAGTASIMMKGLGSALGSLGKLGWIGLIIQAVTTVASAVNRFDKFLKGFNQSFAKLQGPTVLMKDFDKASQAFYKSIFNLDRNLKYGLKSEEIIGIYNNISEAGMSLQGVQQNVLGGMDAFIEETAKSALNFGVSVEEMGGMLGEQMTDLKMSLGETSDSFKTLSYDASIAGIQSQKFYQATYASAEALSYYGKFLDAASNNLKAFQQQGAMGFKDAQKSADEMTGLFKNMDMNQRTMFINMTGGVDTYTKIFGQKMSETNKEIEKHNDSLKVRREALAQAEQEGDTKKVEELKNLISAEEKQMEGLKKNAVMYESALSALSKGALQDVAAYLPAIADETMKLTGDFFKSIRSKAGGIDIFGGNERAIMEQLSKISGMSQDLVMTYLTTAKMNKRNIEELGKDMGDTLDKMDVSKRQGLGAVLSDFKNRDTVDLKELETALGDYLNKDEIGKVIDNFTKFPEALSTLVNEGTASMMSKAKDLALSDFKGLKIVTGESADEQNKRLDSIVKGTHTIEDMLGINAEYAESLLAGNDIQKKIAEFAMDTAMHTGNIEGWVQDIAKGNTGAMAGMTEDEFRKSGKYGELEKLLEKEMLLRTELKGTDDGEKKKVLGEKLKGIEEEKKKVAGRNLHLQSELEGTAAKNVEKIYADLEKARLDLIGTANLQNKSVQTQYNEKKTREQVNKKTYGIINADDLLSKKEEVPKQNDYKANTGGYALLSKGDVVVNAKSMSSGIGGDIGAFAGTAMTDLFRNSRAFDGGRGAQAPTIPVQITIGSVNGNTDEFLKSIKPAIEQAFERMYFDKQKRR